MLVMASFTDKVELMLYSDVSFDIQLVNKEHKVQF